MKFRYLIIDEDEEVTGTNDEGLAQAAAQDGTCIAVVDAQLGAVFNELGGRRAFDETDPEDFLDPEDFNEPGDSDEEEYEDD